MRLEPGLRRFNARCFLAVVIVSCLATKSSVMRTCAERIAPPFRPSLPYRRELMIVAVLLLKCAPAVGGDIGMQLRSPDRHVAVAREQGAAAVALVVAEDHRIERQICAAGEDAGNSSRASSALRWRCCGRTRRARADLPRPGGVALVARSSLRCSSPPMRLNDAHHRDGSAYPDSSASATERRSTGTIAPPPTILTISLLAARLTPCQAGLAPSEA
jgi:hypothetical protein